MAGKRKMLESWIETERKAKGNTDRRNKSRCGEWGYSTYVSLIGSESSGREGLHVDGRTDGLAEGARQDEGLRCMVDRRSSACGEFKRNKTAGVET